MTNEKTNAPSSKKSIITTFSGDIYIIEKTPDEIEVAIKSVDRVRMPSGSWIHKSSISLIQTYEDYIFQVEQKSRHKKGQFLRSGEWHDNQGSLGISAHLEKITGKLQITSPQKILIGAKI